MASPGCSTNDRQRAAVSFRRLDENRHDFDVSAHSALRILMETQLRVHSPSTLHIKVKWDEFYNLVQSSVRYLCRPGKTHKRGNVTEARALLCFHHHHQENKALISNVWKYSTLVLKSDPFFLLLKSTTYFILGCIFIKGGFKHTPMELKSATREAGKPMWCQW